MKHKENQLIFETYAKTKRLNESNISFGGEIKVSGRPRFGTPHNPTDFEKYIDEIISTMSQDGAFETESGRKIYADSWREAIDDGLDGAIPMDELWDQAAELYKRRVPPEEAASKIAL